MIDWNEVAAIVPIVTVPLVASPLILLPLWRWLKEVLTAYYHRNNKCEAIQWQDLSPGRIGMVNFGHTPLTGSQARGAPGQDQGKHGGTISATNVVVDYLQTIWTTYLKSIRRPSYLDVRKEYLQIDADVLLAIVLLDRGFGSADRYFDTSNSRVLHIASTSIQFRMHEEPSLYIIGRLQGQPYFDPIAYSIRGLSKEDLREIGHGYPPFYRHVLGTNAGFEVSHPIQKMRDIHRAGWVVAIGFSRDPPIVLYCRHRAQAYSEACDRVLVMLQRLQGEYRTEGDFSGVLDVAVRAVTRMNAYTSGSGVGAVTEGTIFLDGYHSSIGKSLSVPQVLFALKFANEFRDDPLSADERDRMGRILVEVLRAAVFGVFTWWQYVNNSGREIPLWLLDERIKSVPIWLENRDSDGE